MQEVIKEKNQLNPFLKYSGIALQMLGILAVFGFLGHWLDGHFKTEKPLYTLFFMLGGTLISIYSLIRQLRA
jgi:ATP synthase protein I